MPHSVHTEQGINRPTSRNEMPKRTHKTGFSRLLNELMDRRGVSERDLSNLCTVAAEKIHGAAPVHWREIRRWRGKDGGGLPRDQQKVLALAHALRCTTEDLAVVIAQDYINRNPFLEWFIGKKVERELELRPAVLEGSESSMILHMRRLETERAPPLVDGRPLSLASALGGLLRLCTTDRNGVDQRMANALRRASLLPPHALATLADSWLFMAETTARAYEHGRFHEERRERDERFKPSPIRPDEE